MLFNTQALRRAVYDDPRWRKQRMALIRQADWTCCLCGTRSPYKTGKGLVADHYPTPLAACKTPEDAMDSSNIRIVCRSCHNKVCSRDDNDYKNGVKRGSSATGGSLDINDEWFDY
ncbi:HNH endonuclease [Vibrio algicola]|uniref:HNH endonuclease n=1 Tax=Vibrio algicola TaxID=2662262 RepID=A0A5Q0TK95_9VIBR|nr:hypothetical protein [Vibrio algicola]